RDGAAVVGGARAGDRHGRRGVADTRAGGADPRARWSAGSRPGGEPINVAIHSHEGDTLSLALRLQDEGHAVGFFVEKDGAQRIGNGLVYRITDFPAAAQKADLVLFDQVGSGSLADLLREQGVTVLGASKWTDTIELDRIAGLRT